LKHFSSLNGSQSPHGESSAIVMTAVKKISLKQKWIYLLISLPQYKENMKTEKIICCIGLLIVRDSIMKYCEKQNLTAKQD
jgi:hypothetical protein